MKKLNFLEQKKLLPKEDEIVEWNEESREAEVEKEK